ncbi:hypothetical protein [Cohnella sp. REN36]|uniref:hypothetical protein n=1 Tax=Cohnella sp. REN36 TaxID=2887347 RepID=UPI001D14FEF4|nr:hypothetical protein [Cohnella sp. REN36]MCC3374685.1 hypothetical protein [Cohnella sp. REN36]
MAPLEAAPGPGEHAAPPYKLSAPGVRKATRSDVLHDMLTAVASQETAISCLLQAEAMKIRAFAGPGGDFPTSPSHQQIHDFQTSVTRMIESLADIQRLLLHTVESAQSLLAEQERCDADG